MWLSFLPFEDKGHNAELDSFLKYDKKPDGFGAQAWVAGEIFADGGQRTIVAQERPERPHPGRACSTAIKRHHDFDANGFIAPTDIGGKVGQQVPDRHAGAERQVRARRPGRAGQVRLHRQQPIDVHDRPGEGATQRMSRTAS